MNIKVKNSFKILNKTVLMLERLPNVVGDLLTINGQEFRFGLAYDLPNGICISDCDIDLADIKEIIV